MVRTRHFPVQHFVRLARSIALIASAGLSILLLVPTGRAAEAAADRAAAPDFVEKEFRAMDADGDGRLAAGEIVRHVELLKGADTNGDGFVTLDEVRAHLPKGVARQVRQALVQQIVGNGFKDLDRNGDGVLRGNELSAHVWLRWLDRDGDGGVTLEEARSSLADFGQMIESILDPGPPGEVAPPPLPEDALADARAPRRLKASACGVGTRIPEVPLIAPDGSRRLPPAGSRGTVIALTSATCPLCKKYAPELDRLERDHTESGFAFVFIAVESGAPNDFEGTRFEGRIWRDPEAPCSGRSVREVRPKCSCSMPPARWSIAAQSTIVTDSISAGRPRDRCYLVDAIEALREGRRSTWRQPRPRVARSNFRSRRRTTPRRQ